MECIQNVEVKGTKVLTTRQIASAYGVAEKLIRKNFENNKSRYEEGKHFIYLKGRDLQTFLHTQNLRLQNQSKVRLLYLWTEKGALLHAKSLNTDKAWEVYDYLVDFYFRAKEEPRQQSSEQREEIVPVKTTVEKIPEGLPAKKNYTIPEMHHPVMIFHTLLDLAEKKGIEVLTMDFESRCRSMLYKDRIGIKETMLFKEIVYELAYELSHAMIHYNAGDIIKSPLQKEYNEQAERAAGMIIELLNVKMDGR